MQGSSSAHPPEGSAPRPEGSTPRWGGLLFSRKTAPESQPVPPGLEDLIESYQHSVEEKLEEGLRAIQQTAVSLMHEIAAEMWRASGSDTRDAQAQILSLISRDQAIRSLIAHSDERFQALAVRTARLEDTMADLAESSRALKEVMARSAHALAEAASSPALQGVDEVRDELQLIEEHIAQAFKHLAERDLALVESIQTKVREHGELITQETGRIVEALQAYVQGGVDAMGRLAQRTEDEMGIVVQRVEEHTGAVAQRVEEQMAAVADRDREITELMNETVREQLDQLDRKLAEETGSLTEAFKEHEAWMLRTTEAASLRLDQALERQTTQIGDASRASAIRVAQEMHRTFEARIMGLAQLVRSDSEALRDELVRTAAAHDEATARALDERLERVSGSLYSATQSTVEEITGRVNEHTGRAVQGKFDEVVGAIDRNMVRLTDTLEAQLERVGKSVGQRAAQAADASVATHVGRTVERLESSIEAVAKLRGDMERFKGDTEQSMARVVDDRVGSLARMIRSDNRILAERVQQAAEQEPAKQALRAVKEMQASLAAEVMERVDRRFAAMAEQLHRETQAMAESVAKATEVLGHRIDRVATSVQEGPGRDMQNVIERMGDAMHALASLNRPEQPERIELD